MSTKQFTLEKITYEVKPCTAIAICDEGKEEARRDALQVEAWNEDRTMCYYEHIVFGWPMPETVEAFQEMCQDPSAWEEKEDTHKMKEQSQHREKAKPSRLADRLKAAGKTAEQRNQTPQQGQRRTQSRKNDLQL